MDRIKVRFPPSPTGYLHIGSLRTILYNYLFAKKHGGLLALRIEDTDRTRYVPGAVESLIRTLNRVHLDYDEGPYLEGEEIKQRGECGPYIQSERTELYREHAQTLLENGSGYYCFCSEERLESLRHQQELAKMTTKYDRFCLSLSQEQVKAKRQAGETAVIRLKIPEGETSFYDAIRGTIVFQNQEIDDQVLIKSDGYPTYHLANVVDDHLMQITHVIRGEEWLSSVPKHIALYKAFGWQEPVWAHMPLILNADKSKLSKRQGDVSVEDFLDKGYLPEALINFVALLGFNPRGDQEIYSLQELIDSFELEKVNKSGAVFDREKLLWMNRHYLKQLSDEELVAQAEVSLKEKGEFVSKEFLTKICHIEKARMDVVSDIAERVQEYLHISDYDPAILIWKKADQKDARDNLQGMIEFLTDMPENIFDSIAFIEGQIKIMIEQKGLQNGNVLWPTRVALSGCAQSPSPFELMWILGKEETLKRLTQAVTYLS